MGTPRRRLTSSNSGIRRSNGTMRLIVTTFAGVVFGFFLGVAFPTISLPKVKPSSLLSSIDLTYLEDKYSGLSTQALLNAWSSLKRNRRISNKFNDTKEQKRLVPAQVASANVLILYAGTIGNLFPVWDLAQVQNDVRQLLYSFLSRLSRRLPLEKETNQLLPPWGLLKKGKSLMEKLLSSGSS